MSGNPPFRFRYFFETVEAMNIVNEARVFKLYGELEQWIAPDLVHCESIATRSSLHNWHIMPHLHHGLFQILYLEHGRARITLDDTRRDMAGGQVLLVPQRFIHGFQFEHGAQGHVITIAYPLLSRIAHHLGEELAGLGAPSQHTLGDDADSRLTHSMFTALAIEYRQRAAQRHGRIEALLTAILIWASRQTLQLQPTQLAGRSNQHFAQFELLIEEKYTGHHPVGYYAGRIGITSAHLNTIARGLSGKSALQLIHERVLLEAKRNLAYTSMTVSVVSYALGFGDPAYFTRFFKRHIGLAPKDFRAQAGALMGQ
ncbi:MAG TPA: AraC family transcriptional regulator [Janthinobacterium sp.]|nr:AraC family transcriptional regulator [Janthinobacterium sp.]